MANAVAVHWRMAPAPSVEVVLGGAGDESTLNLGQIEDREWGVLTKTRQLYLGRLYQLCRPQLSDEIGTEYKPLPNRDSKGWGAGHALVEETHGVSTFAPASPTAAKGPDGRDLRSDLSVRHPVEQPGAAVVGAAGFVGGFISGLINFQG